MWGSIGLYKGYIGFRDSGSGFRVSQNWAYLSKV